MRQILMMAAVAAVVASGEARAGGRHLPLTADGGSAQTLAQCLPEGDARQADLRALNLLKRRMSVPTTADID